LAFFGRVVIAEGGGAEIPGLETVVPGVVVAEAGGLRDAPPLVLTGDPQAASTTARTDNSHRAVRFVG